jgi:hypothetical protein
MTTATRRPRSTAAGWRKVTRWLLIAAGATVLVLATRAYLDPAAMIDLANTQLC